MTNRANRAFLLMAATLLLSIPTSGHAAQDVGVWLQNYGTFATLILIFFSGVLVSFTPCVYPMIPITLSIIGARSAGQRPLMGFLRSAVFVLGIAVVYSALGFFGARTGHLFAFLFQNKWFVGALVIFFAAMGFSMMGFMEIQLPARFSGRLQSGANRGGFIGAFLLGLVTGVVASPCGSPVLFTILAVVAQGGKAALGVTMLFTYALGIGTLFLVLGTFPAFLSRIPKSGEWMEDIRRLLGLALFGVAFYYLRLVLSPVIYWPLVLLALLVAAAVVFVASSRNRRPFPKLLWLWRLVGMVLLALAVYFGLVKLPAAFSSKPADMSGWLTSEQAGIAEVKRSGKPMILDFGAEWCVACKELEEKTFSNPEVKQALEGFVLVRVDCTKASDATEKLEKKYGAKALPTVVFVTSGGDLLEDLTLRTYEPPAKFLERLKKVPR